ncbi:MAG: precorrin-2 C(20)-methyltransferase [Caldimicrobium sp.]
MKLYVVGVGPGDPELITLKGYHLLKKCKLIFYPTGGKEALALSIVEKYISKEEKLLVDLYFPMKREKDLKEVWYQQAEKIWIYLSREKEGLFLTLGDPAFYCTFYYIAPFLKQKKVEIEVVPGISSFSLASARLHLPLTLGEEQTLILPAEVYLRNPDEYINCSSIVIMKTHRYLGEILEKAKRYNFSIFLCKRVGQSEEKLWYNLEEVPEDELDYFSLIILKKN